MCRELTKRFEEVVRGAAAERGGAVRGGAEGRDHAGDRAGGRTRPSPAVVAEAQQAVADLVAAGTPRKAAAEVVSRLTGVARNELYRSTL